MVVRWHHRLNGHEFEQAPEVGDGQGSLVCRSPWGRKESDTTEWLNLATMLDINIVSKIRCLGFSCGLVAKNLPCNAEDTGSIPSPGRAHMPCSN